MARLYKSLCYCTNLRRSAIAVTDYYDKALQDTGLSASQYYLLINLSRLKSANVTHWAQHVGLERSTMVRNVRVLQERGWIEELPGGRGKPFTLTEEGRRVLAEAIPRWEKAQTEIEKFLGSEDAEAVMRVAAKLQRLEDSI